MLATMTGTSWIVAIVTAAFLTASSVGSNRVAVRIDAPTEAESAIAKRLADDVWSEEREAGLLDVVVKGQHLAELTWRGVAYRVVVDDVDAVAAGERERLAGRSAKEWFAEYRDVKELDAFIDRLIAQHSSTVKARKIGLSYEGREIRAVEVSRGGTIPIVIDGGLHAREWMSVMVPACIAERLARSKDERIERVLGKVKFLIAPLVNPDGYAYSWTTDRYWRKNRHGEGVDLSRNFSVGWGGAGSSGDPKSSNYRGERAFSEPETWAVAHLFERERLDAVLGSVFLGDVVAHVDFHAYSQVIVYPWSYQRTLPADEKAFAVISERMRAAIAKTHGVQYDVRPGSTLTKGAGGTAGDWSYGERRALSFLVELRPASARDGGFVLPPEQIVPTCDESLNAVLELAEAIIAHETGGDPWSTR